jgi:hypothetical protein
LRQGLEVPRNPIPGIQTVLGYAKIFHLGGKTIGDVGGFVLSFHSIIVTMNFLGPPVSLDHLIEKPGQHFDRGSGKILCFLVAPLFSPV